MPAPNPFDHTTPTWHRTALLATDCKNSVLCEIVNAKANRITYSAYGQQSSQREPMINLGFNGELREASVGWYILGNGYRAYNPRLMRFHNPDKLSPFGKGGLNAYMYCGGEPVMRADPTGQGWIFEVFANLNALFSGVGPGGASASRIGAPVTPARKGWAELVSGGLKHLHDNKRPPIPSSGGKGRKQIQPSWKGSQSRHSSSETRVHWAPETNVATTSTHTTTTMDAQSGSRSRSNSSVSFSSNSSSVSTPSTVSTVSSLSLRSNDSGYASSRPDSIRSHSSGIHNLQERHNNLRQN
jgi:RHS repeat-associated protein